MTSDKSTYLLKRLLGGYLPAHKVKLAVALLSMLVVAACTSLTAYYIQPLFDTGLIDRKIGVLNTIIGALLGLTIIKGIAYYYQGYYMEYIGQRMVADVQQDLYRKLLVQDLAFYQNNPTASLISRFVSDLQRLKMCITQIFSSGLRDTAIIIGLMGNMIYQNWQLTLLTFFIFPPTAVVIARSGKLMRKYSRTNQESIGFLSHLLNQTLGHIRQVQSFTMELSEQKRINTAVDKVFYTSAKAGQIRAFSSPVVEIIGTIVVGVMMFYAGMQIREGSLTPGAFASFMASLVIIIRPIKGLTSLNHILQEGLAAAHRTFSVMDTPTRIVNQPNAKPLKITKGTVSFNEVTVIYPDETVALTDVSFDIKPGQTVALVGASGAGKSTLLNLIPRFYDPAHGKICIDGQDIKAANLTSLRQQISLVSQDVAIFDDTVSANIAYGDPKASKKDIIAAAKMAAADEFIQDLPQGYDTILGENGVKISGGQKQRIAIARALVKNAPVLLLDEATSSLDTESERQVQQALEKLMKGRTTLVIAHRLSTIVNADIIHVLDNGKVRESGTHEELLAKGSLYAMLWNMQSKS
ncbi:MAG: ABC transporter transmembrane domain-containing protein [Alphaproteobacteria bacterium]|nr:ABC transporter transmembrane domain-containing protein [Alphaproteobacteria bacterium]MDD9919691.1 ABC transporter transmembrane domain-containing protein [Alphaproteobacteria bacterium]